ncbi:gastrula zinc finger protein XlCGF26.1-like isoform X2 [Pleurodeles waltl]|uniref:gastrula zinc finger protein XlCGF26.1-like isoform X2 n=1 Tax=Pleurodeles waltl TaxID=8319 RepID=UPI003709BB42
METQIPFIDASCCFSDDDWNLLQEWQKELCGNVMKEIHRALISLGPLIASTVFSLRTKGPELLHPLDSNESERRDSVSSSPSDPSTSHCELFIIKKEENSHMSSPQETDERHVCLSTEPGSTFIDHLGEEIEESNANPDSGVPLITAVFSLSTRPEEGSCVQETTEPEMRTSGMLDSGSMLVIESTTCGENKTFIPNSAHNQYQILQSDDRRTFYTDGKKAIKRIGNRLYLQKYHLVKKRFPCTYCGKSFIQKSYLLRHQRTHTGEKPFSCTECTKSFTQLSILQRHQRSHTGEKPFLCTECGKTFSQQAGLKRHQKIHMDETEKPFPCFECGKCFVYKSDFQRHQRIHAKKSFVYKLEFQQDHRIQIGEKPFPCTECGKSFTHQGTLKRHLKIHSGDIEKHFSCNECGKGFVYKSDFERHQRIHTGEKPFICPECGKRFTRRSVLRSHQRSHNEATFMQSL